MVLVEMDAFALFHVTANGITHHIATVKGFAPAPGSYNETGKPLVVFLHGWPEIWYSWRYQLVALANAGYPVCAPDLRGFGGTEAPLEVESYKVDTICQDVLGIASELGYETIVPIGHDLGANVAWHLALMHPQRIASVVGLSMPYTGHPKAPPLELLQRTHGRCLSGDQDKNCKFHCFLYNCLPYAANEYDKNRQETLYRTLAGGADSVEKECDVPEVTDHLMFPPKWTTDAHINDESSAMALDARHAPGPWLRFPRPKNLPEWLLPLDLDYYIQEYHRTGFRGGLYHYLAMDEGWNRTMHLKDSKIEQPTLFLVGDQDGFIWEVDGEKQKSYSLMKHECPNLKKLLCVPGGGHHIQQQFSDMVSKEIIDFLSSVNSGVSLLDQAIMVPRNDSGFEPPAKDETIVLVLAMHYETQPDHQFLTWVDKKLNETDHLNYDRLWKQSGHVADLLLSKGIKRGDRVMIAYPFGLDFLSGMFGCMRAGVIACSVYPPNPSKTTDLDAFAQQANDAGAKFALTTGQFKQMARLSGIFNSKKLGVKWLATDGKFSGVSSGVSRHAMPSQDDVAFIQYTSGSTSTPKGVIISHRSLIHNVYHCRVVAKVRSLMPVVSFLPQYHDMGLIGFFLCSVYSGCRGVGCSPLDFILNPILWHDMVIKCKAAVTLAPNFSYGLVVKRLRNLGNNYSRWTSVETLLCAAEPVDPDVMNQVTTVLGVPASRIIIEYGLAECGLGAGYVRFTVSKKLVACAPLDGFSSIRVVDNSSKNHSILRDGGIGEIWIRAPNLLAEGYWGKPQLTQEAFRNTLLGEDGHWLATGDLGKIIGDNVYVTGRSKDVIIVNGKNYFPVDIELSVEKAFSGSVRPGCVVAFQYGDSGVALAAEIRKGTRQEDIPSTIDLCKTVASANQVQIDLIWILKDHTIPKTTSGKLKRAETKKKCLSKEWPAKAIIRVWKRNDNVLAVSSTVRGSKNLEKGRGDIARFVPGADYGTHCPHAQIGLEAFFEGMPSGLIYHHKDGVPEDATVDYENVILELRSMERRMSSGEMTRSYEGASLRFADMRFWTTIPGVCPHPFSLSLPSNKHDAARPWIEGKLSTGFPSLSEL